MESIKVEERFMIVSHTQTEKPYRIVGSAYKNVKEDYFKFFLRLLPGIPYYLAPHRDRNWEYLVFSGCAKRGASSARFFCKIGSAVLLPEKNAIEIHLPDLRQVFYLRLEPEDFHYGDAGVA